MAHFECPLTNQTTLPIYKSSLDTELDVVPSFKLYPNFPNPFNPITTINYEIAEQTNVKINIYNIQGELIETLLNEKKDRGVYSIQWNANQYSSGVYFYKIIAGAYSDTRRMLLLK